MAKPPDGAPANADDETRRNERIEAAESMMYREAIYATRERIHVLERDYRNLERAIHVAALRTDALADALSEMRKAIDSLKESVDGVTSP